MSVSGLRECDCAPGGVRVSSASVRPKERVPVSSGAGTPAAGRFIISASKPRTCFENFSQNATGGECLRMETRSRKLFKAGDDPPLAPLCPSLSYSFPFSLKASGPAAGVRALASPQCARRPVPIPLFGTGYSLQSSQSMCSSVVDFAPF